MLRLIPTQGPFRFIGFCLASLPLLFLMVCYTPAFAQCPHSLPYSENFSTNPFGSCSGANGGWTSTSVSSGAGWYIPATNYAGGASPEAEGYGDQACGGCNETIRLTAPALNTAGISSVTLLFKHNLYLTNSGASGSGTITVKAESSPDNSNWTQQYAAGFSATPSLTQVLHETRTLTISGLSGNTLYLRFSVSGVLFKVWGWEIDDVNVTAAVVPPPTVSNFNATSACAGSNATVIITGTGFTGASGVSFNGTAAAFTINSDTQISATLPAGAGTGTISVSTPGGTATSSGSFTVYPLPADPSDPTSNSPQCLNPGVIVTRSGSAPAGETWWWQNSLSGTLTTYSGSTFTATAPGTLTVYLRSQNNVTGCWSAGAGSISVTVNDVPAQPGSITGPINACSGISNTYSVTSVSGASSYTWTLPGGWTGVSNTNSINATSGVTGGTISVTANNTCGNSVAQTLTINLSATPAMPGSINGATSVCLGISNTYSVTAVSGATSYTWTLPGGWTGVSTTNSISATAGATGGTISVTANNTCGSSAAQTLLVNMASAPAMPGAISGPASVCLGISNTYSVTAVSGATSYTWTLPGGWTGVSTTNSISATAGATGGAISVTANNTCGSSAAQTLLVNMASAPAMPGAIAGPASVCLGISNTYSVTAVSGATSYTWTLPGGWTGVSTTNSISATAGATGGTISVTANNTCGSSAAQTLLINMASTPAMPGAISGPDSVCSGNSETFSVSAVGGAMDYTWTLPGGWSGSSTTNSIGATAGVSGGIISVTANNICGSSSPQTLAVNIQTTPSTPGIINGPNSVCAGSSNSYTVAVVGGAFSYTWILPAGWTGSSNSENVTAVAGTAGGNIAVTASNTCGQSASQVRNISVNPLPVVDFSFAPNPVCDKDAPLVLNSGNPAGGIYTGSGVNNGIFYPVQVSAGTYPIIYEYTDIYGCSASDTSNIIVTICSGLSSTAAVSGITVCPNPFHDNLTIKGRHSSGIRNVVLLDETGRVIQMAGGTPDSPEIHLHTGSLSRGVYFLRITGEGEATILQKLVKTE